MARPRLHRGHPTRAGLATLPENPCTAPPRPFPSFPVRYDDKYPEKASLRAAYPNQMHGPFPPVPAAPFLEQSWRVFPCVECKRPTGWRTVLPGLSIATCSEECRRAATEDLNTSAPATSGG